MIESSINTPLTLTSNDSAVAFPIDSLKTRSASCCRFFQHNEGSPLYKILECGIYEISFTGTVTSATAGIVALGIYEDGILLPDSVGAETLATAGDLANISTKKNIRVCCNSNTTLSLQSVPSVLATATLVATETQIPIITSGNITVKKVK